MIVLQILKIIGLVLAGIVGLVILLLLVVCFAPIRYKVVAKGENADMEGEASAVWIFGLAKAALEYRGKQLSYYVRVAGIRIIKGVLGKDEAEALREVLEEEDVIADRKQYEKISKELQKAEEKAEKAEAEKEEKRREKEERRLEKEAEKEEKKQEKKAQKEEQKRLDKLKSLKERIRARIDRLKELYEKFQTIKRIWQAKATKRALKRLKVELFNILNHLKPKKISGDLGFGLEDPADTAIIYGNAAPIAEALGKGKLILIPEFYKKGIHADLLIRGRIFLGYMILCIARLYFDRDVQRVIKVIRRYLNG